MGQHTQVIATPEFRTTNPLSVKAKRSKHHVSKIAELIEKHRAARTAYLEAGAKVDAAYDEAQPYFPPLQVEISSRPSVLAWTEKEIITYVDRLEKTSFGPGATPAKFEEMRRLKCEELRILTGRYNHTLNAFNIPELEATQDEMGRVEIDLWWKLINEPASSTADMSAKAQYFLAMKEEDENSVDEEHLIKVLRSMVIKEAA
ncbi:hypothetical protein QFZ34_003238 [Phyllobacterium ifriqiyense]|uniref:Terminase small subunit n=1 Tax=Phyllobacterium ifriqiyense TaxID=314238 RepID=A0ABU0SBD6_9HYPH|nr:hypothetical protein [Phyllobacterium ifriqiyense]MDQ0998056.1 hypothetical protein [Phyllobacterium ifriqiyense]